MPYFFFIDIFAPILFNSGTAINLLENTVSSITLFPDTLVKTARIIGMLSVANCGQGPVLIDTGFVFLPGEIMIDFTLISILYPIFFNIFNSVFKYLGSIFFTLILPLVIAATHK